MKKLPKIRVGIVSDVKLYREGVAQSLSARDRVTVLGTASDLPGALALCEKPKECMLLLDMGMADAMKLLRSISNTLPEVKTVAFAIDEVEDDVIACAEAGIAGYVPRDASLEGLATVVDSVSLDELICSPKIASRLQGRLAAKPGTVGHPAEGVLTPRERQVWRLLDKIRSRDARVAVIGLGYVGLPLAVEFAKAGLTTVALDVDGEKIARLEAGESYIADVSGEDVREVTRTGMLRPTTDFAELADVDTVDICVPTPLRKTRDPDLSYVVAVVDEIARHLHAGQLIILESTTYPGTIEEVVRPTLEAGGLSAGRDFYLAFSPERVDPGNAQWTTRNIPKVVGGVNEASTWVAVALYEQIVDTVVPVSSPTVAETVKLFENTFRAVNIGLANELALMCRELGVDVWEVIEAAKTKPFGYMPFYPGPGLGGHCLPIDPLYLSWKAKQSGFDSRFINLADHVNAGMPRCVVERVADALNSGAKSVKGSRVHLFGMAYKPNVSDVRESPSIDVALLLTQRGATVTYTDAFVPRIDEGTLHLESVSLEAAVAQGIDCAVITTDHRGLDYADLARRVPAIVDTRNVLKGIAGDHIFRLWTSARRGTDPSAPVLHPEAEPVAQGLE